MNFVRAIAGKPADKCNEGIEILDVVRVHGGMISPRSADGITRKGETALVGSGKGAIR